MDNFNKLQVRGLPLSNRELSILAVATTILQQRGQDPFKETIIIQVDWGSVKLKHRGKNHQDSKLRNGFSDSLTEPNLFSFIGSKS